MAQKIAVSDGVYVPKSIVNYATGGGKLSSLALYLCGAKQILAGTLAADINTFSTLLDLTGQGSLDLLGCRSKDGAAKTLRCRVTLDGTVVFDGQAASPGVESGLLIVGTQVGTHQASVIPRNFKISCKVEVACSVAETDQSAIDTIYSMR